jgi:hypothetical protein
MHHGVITISTTSTSGNRSAWAFDTHYNSTSDSESLLAKTNIPWEIVIIFRYPNSTSYTASNFFLGLAAGTTDNPPRGLVLRYLAGTDPNFMFAFHTPNSWTGSLVNTGVAPDTNWHRLKIRSDGNVSNKIWLSRSLKNARTRHLGNVLCVFTPVETP